MFARYAGACILAGLGSLAALGEANAAIVRYEFAAVVDAVNNNGATAPVSVGQGITGFFEFTDPIDISPSLVFGTFSEHGTKFSIDGIITIAPNTNNSAGTTNSFFNGSEFVDLFSIQGAEQADDFSNLTEIVLLLRQHSASAAGSTLLSSDALPSSIDLSLATERNYFSYYSRFMSPSGTFTDFVVEGHFTDLQRADVPEPATLALLGAGLLSLGLRRRKIG